MTDALIAVVDDDKDFAESVGAVLETRGHRVRTGNSGAECMALLASEPHVDLVLLDVRLGQESGLNVLAKIRANYPDIPCVMLTAYSTLDTALTALREGAFDHLSKPPDAERLFAVVERALRLSRVTREAREAQRALARRTEELERLSASQAEALEALRLSEGRLAGILDIAADGILAIDAEQRIARFNKSAEEIFGYSAHEVLGQPLAVLLPEEAKTEHGGYVERVRQALGAVRMPMPARGAVQGRRKDGSLFPAEVSISKVGDREAAIMTAIVRDITDRQRAEEQLRHAQRMEVVGRMAGSVAHDFNNILTVIISCAAALDGAITDDELRDDLEVLMDASDRAVHITGQLLALSRRQVLEAKAADLSEVIATMMPLLERIVGQEVTLRTTPTRDPLPVFLDVGQLEQVLLNLTINARDAMPAGGTIEVRTCRARVSEQGEVTPAEDGDRGLILVSDPGTGMAPETIERIFEPFFTTKPASEGVGLGLSTVYGIVKQFRGDIRVESKEGEGTTFTVLLPLRTEVAPEKSAATQRELRAPAEGKTLLLVEDDPIVQRTTAKILTRAKYHVLRASNGEQALEVVARAEPGEIDLVLSDVVMPVMSGPELALHLKRVLPGVPVLFMTGFAAGLSERYGLELSEVVPKPFHPAMLLRRIAEALAGGSGGALPARQELIR